MRKIILSILILFSGQAYLYSQDTTFATVKDTVRLDLFSKSSLDTNNFNIFPKSYSRKTVALVLSGGGARGLAQLGVLKELERNNIRIDMIVGTSMGALIGGLYSSGYKVNEVVNILEKFNWNKALSLTNNYQRTSLFLEQKKVQDRSLLTIPLDGIKPVILPSSFSNGLYLSEKINSYILNSRYHSKDDFSKLMIPFAAVATDLDKGKAVVLKKGNLSESIKASLTFPLLYTPIIIDGKNMVDGGLTANIPNDIAKKLGADFTIVVNSTSNLRSNKELDDPLNTADQILSITMAQLNELQLNGANLIITPDIKKYSAVNYREIDYLIKKGEEKTAELMSRIKLRIDSLELSESRYLNNFITNPEIEITSDFVNTGLNDTLIELSDKNFEKYTSIEKNLKMIYNTGEYSEMIAEVSRSGFSATINYILKANPVLKNLKIENPVFELDSMISAFRIYNTGKIINLFEYHKFYDDLLGKLRANSYSVIDIEKFYFDHGSHTLEIKFSKGKISGIELVGNKTTNDNVILREIKLDPASTVKKRNTDESIKNIMSTNLFRQVSFEYDFSKNIYDPELKINMVEKNTKALRFSLKADNVRNLQLMFDLRDENIFGTAIETGLLAAGGLRNRIYQFDIKSNQFFSLPLTFNYNLFYKFTDIYRYAQVIDTTKNEFDVFKTGEYRDQKYGMSFLLGAQVKRFGTIYGQIFFENLAILNKFDSQNLTEDLRVIKLKFGAVFDTEDRIPFPTKGTLFNFYYETANNTLQSKTSFTKLYFSFDQYFPVAKSQILRPRFIFGFGDNTTPLTEQFYLGGQNSFFGMVEDELVGRQILEASLEYRYLFPYKIFFDTYFSVRYDLGNVWQVAEDIRFRDLRHGLGLSLEFDTPIGEASFSVGRSFIVKKGLTQDSFIFGPYDFYYSIGYDI